ncbi:uncharacterized protein LOC116105348 [Pistacia vera]|uniref:uncharacterized protein LOC116105348 n=1 Tax=Pistacia vera TaxID=55513 RepID=UPI0012639292|nr:uncharacterized protein LOC116105348 [Pistacia vera]
MANLTSEILDSGLKVVKEQIDSARAMSSVAHSSLPTLLVKLGEKNYSYWRSQTLPALASYELDGFVTGVNPCLPMFIVEKMVDYEQTVKKPNPKYFDWKKTDQFLLSWLVSSISESMFRHVAKCISAYEIWNTLELYFQSFSKARTLHLRNLLQSTKKESMSVNEYILRMKEIGDELVASGVQIGEKELLLYILDGLGPEYDAMVANLIANSSSTTIQEAQLLLHKHEMRIEKQNSVMTNFHEQMTSALLVAKQVSIDPNNVSPVQNFNSTSPVQKLGPRGGIFQNPGSSSLVQPNMTYTHHEGYTQQPPNLAMYTAVSPHLTTAQYLPTSGFQFNNNGMRGRGRGRGYFRPRLVCQVGGKPSHSTLQCYHRFDYDYHGFQPHNPSSIQPANSPIPPPITNTQQYSGSSHDSAAQVQVLYAANFLQPKNAVSSYDVFHDFSATGGTRGSSPSPTTPGYHSQVPEFQSFPQSGPMTSTNNSTMGQLSATPVLPISNSQAIATPQTVADKSWYMDSGASNHMIADVSNLMLKSPYQRGSQV